MPGAAINAPRRKVVVGLKIAISIETQFRTLCRIDAERFPRNEKAGFKTVSGCLTAAQPFAVPAAVRSPRISGGLLEEFGIHCCAVGVDDELPTDFTLFVKKNYFIGIIIPQAAVVLGD